MITYFDFFGFAIITSITATCFTAANVSWQETERESIDEVLNNTLLSLSPVFVHI